VRDVPLEEPEVNGLVSRREQVAAADRLGERIRVRPGGEQPPLRFSWTNAQIPGAEG
jgi:hypothetical protein